MFKITSENNEKYKILKKLLVPKGRKDFKKFLAEGKKFLSFKPDEIFINELFYDEKVHKNAIILSNELFNNISSHQNSQGIISLFKVKNCEKLEGDFILVLDRIRDPGNLGTIVRTAEFLGINDIILINCVDIYNPKVVRATMGAIFNINFLEWKKEKILSLKEEGYNIISTSSYNYDSLLNDIDINVKGKVALILGNETEGVDINILEKSDLKIKIPSFGTSESLNVSSAASIFLYSIKMKRR